MTTRNAFQEEIERRKAAVLAADEANPEPEGRVITRANLPEWQETPRQLGHYCPECEKDVNVTVADEASGQPDANGLTPLRKVARCIICNGKAKAKTPPPSAPKVASPAVVLNEIGALIKREVERTLGPLLPPEAPPVTLPKPRRPRTLMQDAKKRLAEVKRAIAANQRELTKLQREMVELEIMTGTHPTVKPASVARIGGAK